MKKNAMVKAIAAAAILLGVLVLAGCPLDEEETVSVAQRVNLFVADLNGNYANVYLNWHPDTTTRQAAANPSTLETRFPSSDSGSYEVTDIVADEAAGTATALITSNVALGEQNGSASFTMRKDGDNWLIRSLTIAGVTLSSVE
jgi:hypothetical protein